MNQLKKEERSEDKHTYSVLTSSQIQVSGKYFRTLLKPPPVSGTIIDPPRSGDMIKG